MYNPGESQKDSDPNIETTSPVFDISMAISIEVPAKINLSAIDTTQLSGSDKQFAEWLIESKRVIYDWGRAVFYVSNEPFVIDRAAKAIIPTPNNSNWVGVNQEQIYEIAGGAWEGQWSPLAADALLTMLNSGVDVEIINSGTFGPSDPEQYVRLLRSRFNTIDPLPK